MISDETLEAWTTLQSLNEAATELLNLRKRCRELEDALRPFAVLAYHGGFHPDLKDDDLFLVRVGDIRKAETVMRRWYEKGAISRDSR